MTPLPSLKLGGGAKIGRGAERLAPKLIFDNRRTPSYCNALLVLRNSHPDSSGCFLHSSSVHQIYTAAMQIVQGTFSEKFWELRWVLSLSPRRGHFCKFKKRSHEITMHDLHRRVVLWPCGWLENLFIFKNMNVAGRV